MLSNTERKIIQNVVHRLKHGETTASERIKVMLADDAMRCWLQSWVIGPLELMSADNRTRDDMKTALSLSR